MPSPYSIWPDNHFGPELSVYVAYGLGVVLPFAVFIVAVIICKRYARSARLAKAAYDPDTVLAEGPAIIVGVVQHAAKSDRAVVVYIEQEATEHESSGSWSHRWTEVDRRVHVSPFYLQRPQGERIRIQATNKVFLVDDMDGCIHYDQLRRTRIIELVPDEEVIAVGVLRQDFDPEGRPQGYRDSPMGWILEPPRNKPMQLSSEPLEDRFLRLHRFHATAAISLLVVFAAAQLTLFNYHWRLFGETSTATVVSKRHYTTEDDEGVTDHWEVIAETPWGEYHEENIEEDSWHHLDAGTIVPIRHAGHGFVQYGEHATLPFFVAPLLFLLALSIGMYVAATGEAKRWYSKKVVDEGTGRIDKDTGLDDPN